jgi:hypothetical protein
MSGQAGEPFRITWCACFQQLELNPKAIKDIQGSIEPCPTPRTGCWIENDA